MCPSPRSLKREDAIPVLRIDKKQDMLATIRDRKIRLGLVVETELLRGTLFKVHIRLYLVGRPSNSVNFFHKRQALGLLFWLMAPEPQTRKE